MNAPAVLKVAVPCPLRKLFDYLPPRTGAAPQIGARVRVPFGKRTAIGLVMGRGESALGQSRLKSISAVLDAKPLLDDATRSLLIWAADYYHHPIGEVVGAALPGPLRRGRPPAFARPRVYRLTETGRDADLGKLARAPAQRRLLQVLHAAPTGLARARLSTLGKRALDALRTLEKKSWVEAIECDDVPPAQGQGESPPRLNLAQSEAVDRIVGALGAFQAFLLHGITGSGKTEVYLRLVETVLARGRQALVLVPEIALTPQLIARFARRFAARVAVLHSARTEQERLVDWLAARDGSAPIVLGTRSAVFAVCKNLGIVIVDEEHDASYKQQEGFRYHARDLAVLRASRQKVPVVLGSATPSLESFQRAAGGAYRLLRLPERTGAAGLPRVELIDMRRQPRIDGLSPALKAAVGANLAAGEQTILFLNRRGFAPVWMCHDCGWLAPCDRCDARLILHRRRNQLRCHHCGHAREIILRCAGCGGENLHAVGEGTERVEQAIARAFPRARALRVDRDTTQAKGALEEKLRLARDRAADILIGTQILSKGHDFPSVTLVGVLNADQGLFNLDFRAPERLFQLILQVAGRAGRAAKPGVVMIQTWHPEHPLFAALRAQDFDAYARYLLDERRDTRYPPHSHLALLRAESPAAGAALAFLRVAHARALDIVDGGEITVADPVPAPMERRAGRYRAQLLVQSSRRASLHRFLSIWIEALENDKAARKARWSIDVDPMDLY